MVRACKIGNRGTHLRPRQNKQRRTHRQKIQTPRQRPRRNFRKHNRHSSQKENLKKSNDKYAIFEYDLKPTYELIQELLTMNNQVEIVEPNSLRIRMKETIDSMEKMYKGKQTGKQKR